MTHQLLSSVIGHAMPKESNAIAMFLTFHDFVEKMFSDSLVIDNSSCRSMYDELFIACLR